MYDDMDVDVGQWQVLAGQEEAFAGFLGCLTGDGEDPPLAPTGEISDEEMYAGAI